METIDNIRAEYARNLFRTIRYFNGLCGGLTYSRALKKYKKQEGWDPNSVNYAEPFCIYSEDLGSIVAFISTPIYRAGEEFLRYFEVVFVENAAEEYICAQIYNYKTGVSRVLTGDPAVASFLFLLPPSAFAVDMRKNLKLIN